MPIYDYRCTQCGHEIEVVHGIYDSGPSICTACGGTMRKALSTPAIHFKGSGWAKKDAASASRARSSTGAADPATGSQKGTDGGSTQNTDSSTGKRQDTPKPADGGTGTAPASPVSSKDG
jgi:putative FmdB family regulatory protein